MNQLTWTMNLRVMQIMNHILKLEIIYAITFALFYSREVP